MQIEEVKAKTARVARRTMWLLLALSLVAAVGYYFYRTFVKSDGTRSGTLVQISRTGYVFKTYEGQLHLSGSMQITEQSTWYFSAKDANVYNKLQEWQGKVVECHYRRLVDPFPWQGKTEYIVDDVRLIQ